ncbi:hypothetical protein BDU57DRAFT_144313 [Ampelomyces quisqualis]|uniref:Uncharacterized protein n=1 Tax=Ampelomyces quisqualis TaxID=50730 RepID=A0A6A5R0B9_AMPQU|nr:hypothetical protein BDU57DRAFT_144313 [Ampelomyces quisqualis]
MYRKLPGFPSTVFDPDTVLYRPRNVSLISLFSLGGGYLMLKSRTFAEKQKAAGDYSVPVDRSGTSVIVAPLLPVDAEDYSRRPFTRHNVRTISKIKSTAW